MAKQTMTRKASDNDYCHKDFHGALSYTIEYLDQHYGEDAVQKYLHRFAHTFYVPLKDRIRELGLAALKEHIEEVYRTEGGQISIDFSDDEMIVEVAACPAVTHMRSHGYRVARLFHKTTEIVNQAICEGTSYVAELLEYDDRTGRSIQRFRREQP